MATLSKKVSLKAAKAGQRMASTRVMNPEFAKKITTPEEAAKFIKTGTNVGMLVRFRLCES